MAAPAPSPLLRFTLASYADEWYIRDLQRPEIGNYTGPFENHASAELNCGELNKGTFIADAYHWTRSPNRGKK